GAAVQGQVPRHDVEHGCFAGAVGPDEADDFALIHGKGDVRQHAAAHELLAHRLKTQEAHERTLPLTATAGVPLSGWRSRARRRACSTKPHSPPGKNRTDTMTSRAKTSMCCMPTARSASEAT